MKFEVTLPDEPVKEKRRGEWERGKKGRDMS